MAASLVLATAAPHAVAQPGRVLSHQKISDTGGGFAGNLREDDRFGAAVVMVGDLDGNGVGGLAVGARSDDDGGTDRGAVWVLFLDTDGTVMTHQKISDTEGRFAGALEDGGAFGVSLAAIGDLDGDGVGDLAVGASLQGDAVGATWILMLDPDGTVKSSQKIDDASGGFTGALEPNDHFGSGLAGLGDLDGDDVPDLAVGADGDDDGGAGRGAVWVLFLDVDGTVKGHQKISDTEGDFIGALDDADRFGGAMGALDDLDGDGVTDLAVGAGGDDDGGPGRGAVWVLFLDDDGTVKTHQKISSTEGDFTGELDDMDDFRTVSAVGDLDGDAVLDLAVGAPNDDGGAKDDGAVWVLFLRPDGRVKTHAKISAAKGGFTGELDSRDRFGSALASLGDVDGDGETDLAVGVELDDDGGHNRGAVWVLFLDGARCVADLDDSGAIDFGDILVILAAWGRVGGPEDLDDSGLVDFGDILVVLGAWGPC